MAEIRSEPVDENDQEDTKEGYEAQGCTYLRTEPILVDRTGPDGKPFKLPMYVLVFETAGDY